MKIFDICHQHKGAQIFYANSHDSNYDDFYASNNVFNAFYFLNNIRESLVLKQQWPDP